MITSRRAMETRFFGWNVTEVAARAIRTCLARARFVAVQALGLEIIEVILKAPLNIQSEIAQKRPGIDAGGVHIIEPEPHRIIADRIDGENRHVAFSANRLALRFGVTLHFGRGAGDAKQFCGKAESLAIVECDMQRSAVLREPDFNRPNRCDVRHAQVTVLFTFSGLRLPIAAMGLSALPGGTRSCSLVYGGHSS